MTEWITKPMNEGIQEANKQTNVGSNELIKEPKKQ